MLTLEGERKKKILSREREWKRREWKRREWKKMQKLFPETPSPTGQ